MNNSDVIPGAHYIAKVSGKMVRVEVLYRLSLGKGWSAINQETGRRILIRSAQRLREEIVK